MGAAASSGASPSMFTEGAHASGSSMLACGPWLLLLQEGVLEPLLELFYTREDGHDGQDRCAGWLTPRPPILGLAACCLPAG